MVPRPEHFSVQIYWNMGCNVVVTKLTLSVVGQIVEYYGVT